MSGFDPNEDVVEVIETGGEARRYQCCRVILVYQQWPADAAALVMRGNAILETWISGSTSAMALAAPTLAGLGL